MDGQGRAGVPAKRPRPRAGREGRSRGGGGTRGRRRRDGPREAGGALCIRPRPWGGAAGSGSPPPPPPAALSPGHPHPGPSDPPAPDSRPPPASRARLAVPALAKHLRAQLADLHTGGPACGTDQKLSDWSGLHRRRRAAAGGQLGRRSPSGSPPRPYRSRALGLRGPCLQGWSGGAASALPLLVSGTSAQALPRSGLPDTSSGSLFLTAGISPSNLRVPRQEDNTGPLATHADPPRTHSLDSNSGARLCPRCGRQGGERAVLLRGWQSGGRTSKDRCRL